MKFYLKLLIATVLIVSWVTAEEQVHEELEAVESKIEEVGANRQARVVPHHHHHHLPLILKKKLLFFKFKKIIPLSLFLLKSSPNGEQVVTVDGNGNPHVSDEEKVQFQAYIIPNETPLDVQPVNAEEDQVDDDDDDDNVDDDSNLKHDDNMDDDSDKEKDAVPLLVYALQRPVSGERPVGNLKRRLSLKH